MEAYVQTCPLVLLLLFRVAVAKSVPFEALQVGLVKLVIRLCDEVLVECFLTSWSEKRKDPRLTLFLFGLCMASNASLMVTPLRFRATTVMPRGNSISIFLTGGVVSIFLRISLSSTDVEDELIFLCTNKH